MANLYEIQPTDCIGNSRVNINSNFREVNDELGSLQETVDSLRTDVARLSSLEEATKKYVNNRSFYEESTFVYGFSNIKRPSSLANRWTDIYTNTFRDPLKIQIRLDEGPKAVLIQGKIHVMHVQTAISAWVRLARFDSPAREIQPVEVLDIASTQGTAVATLGTQVNLNSVYILQPGVNYVFGLQTYFWLDATAAKYLKDLNTFYQERGRRIVGGPTGRIIAKNPGPNVDTNPYDLTNADVLNLDQIYYLLVAKGAERSSVVINGWKADDSYKEQYANTINPFALKDIQATNKYLNDGQSGTNRIGKNTKYGYGFDEQAIERGVKNTSWIRAIVL
jgi:hypothetical protein